MIEKCLQFFIGSNNLILLYRKRNANDDDVDADDWMPPEEKEKLKRKKIMLEAMRAEKIRRMTNDQRIIMVR